MNSVGEDYDKDGETARSGKVDEKLLNELNSLTLLHEVRSKIIRKRGCREYFYSINRFI